MNKDTALEALTKLQKYPTFLLFGTLLGALRDGDFIDWDEDMDVGILWEDWSESMIPKLEAEGFTTYVNIFWPATGNGPKRIMELGGRGKVRLEYKGVYMCLEVLTEEDGYRWSYAGEGWGAFKCPSELLAETRPLTFKGIEVLVPARAEEFLTFMYGDWATPKKDWYTSEAYKEQSKKWKQHL